MEYLDPEDGQEVAFWRINEQVGKVVVLTPLTEHPEQTEYGVSVVIDCEGGVWDGSGFSPVGNVRIFQEVLQKKLRPALAREATVIAKLVKPGVAYDLRPVDADTRKKVADAWDATEPPVQQSF